jgi:hypothetical protein
MANWQQIVHNISEMSPDRWQQIEAVFQTAVDLKASERQAFIEMACGGDQDLRSEIEKLMADYESADSFIESPVWTDSNFLNSSAKKIISESIKKRPINSTRTILRAVRSGRIV